MNGDRQSLFDRLFHASLLVLGMAIALYYAACLLLSVWHVLVAIGLVLIGVTVLVAALRYRRERW